MRNATKARKAIKAPPALTALGRGSMVEKACYFHPVGAAGYHTSLFDQDFFCVHFFEPFQGKQTGKWELSVDTQ